MKKILALVLALTLLLCTTAMASSRELVYFGELDGSPISWMVLSRNEDTTVLLTEYALICRKFDNHEEATNSWRGSSLRKYLNSKLLYQAFSDEEIAAIQTVSGDLVRIPSLKDLTNPDYGFSSNRADCDPARQCFGGYGAHADGLWTNAEGLCSYFTLTASNNGDNLYQIRTDGSTGVAKAGRDNVGVRMMIVVDTEMLAQLAQ